MAVDSETAAGGWRNGERRGRVSSHSSRWHVLTRDGQWRMQQQCVDGPEMRFIVNLPNTYKQVC